MTPTPTAAPPAPLIALCAGEASGDLLGAHLIKTIRRYRPDARFVGIGGPRMIAAGFESLFEQERLAVRGYTEVLKRLPEILRIRRRLTAQLKTLRPAVFVGIDAPDFNLGVSEQLKAAGIPTVHYVSPSVWAWKRERVRKIVQQTGQVLCLFPMEPQLYREAGGKALFVGHPLAQTLPQDADKTAARTRLKLPEDSPVFALMPGSRVSEIDYMAPLFLRAAALVLRELPDAHFLLPYPTAAARERLKHYLAEPEFEKLPVRLQAAKADLACTAADAVLVTSGTATLETALCKRPMVISYKISPITYALVRRKIKIPHVGLPNILLGRECVPELMQGKAKPALLAEALLDWYRQPEKAAELAESFTRLHTVLQGSADDLAAQAVLAAAGFATPAAVADDAARAEDAFAQLQRQEAAKGQPENPESAAAADETPSAEPDKRQPENQTANPAEQQTEAASSDLKRQPESPESDTAADETPSAEPDKRQPENQTANPAEQQADAVGSHLETQPESAVPSAGPVELEIDLSPHAPEPPVFPDAYRYRIPTADSARPDPGCFNRPPKRKTAAPPVGKPASPGQPENENLLFFKHIQKETYAVARHADGCENLLRLSLSDTRVDEPTVISLTPHPYGGSHRLRIPDVAEQVALGCADAAQRCGRSFHIAEIGFIPNDTPPVSVYRPLTETLLARVADGGEFVPTNFTDT